VPGTLTTAKDGRLSHKAVSEMLLLGRGDGREGGECDDVGTDAPRVTDAMADFGTHP